MVYKLILICCFNWSSKIFFARIFIKKIVTAKGWSNIFNDLIIDRSIGVIG